MHYKNGRPALNGDAVIATDYNGKVTVGIIHSLRAGDTCNCDVAVIVPGAVAQLTCQDVNKLYHAEDALRAIEPVPGPVINP